MPIHIAVEEERRKHLVRELTVLDQLEERAMKTVGSILGPLPLREDEFTD